MSLAIFMFNACIPLTRPTPNMAPTMEWLVETGIPKMQKLKELNLKDVAHELIKLGKISESKIPSPIGK